ncbi:MAG TPA: hypothetical protein DDZ88_16630 [Verrucomicrobiales bacterium]|nr:hypothetical protein [Verrucomicrobiales bacterium]
MKQAFLRKSSGFTAGAAWLGLFAAMMGNLMAQTATEARVAASSVQTEPVAGGKEIRVTLRLMDALTVTSVTATLGAGATKNPVPILWTAFDALPPPADCAWMVVVDNSNPARQQTIEACADAARSFLKLLPKSDTVMIASLARDLVVAAPFGSTPPQLEAALAGMKAEGDASFTTLIFQNVKHALADHLSRRAEARRCVVLLTDGKDETPGGPLRITERRNELITEARKLGIPVHTLGFAEKATEANYFADLKELSLQTDGLHIPAAVSTRQLPPDTWPLLIGVMRSGGTALLDLADVKESGALRLELTCDTGRKAVIEIPKDMVEAALHVPSASAQTPAIQNEGAWHESIPAWSWWAAGAVILLLLVLMKARTKNPQAPQARTSPAARPEAPSKAPVHEMPQTETPVEVPPASNAFLEMMDAGNKRHPLPAKGLKIGSGKHNDVVVKHDSVSEYHCLVSLQNGEWVIADTNSVNGVQVNGTHYHQATLSPGDVIQIGEVRMRFLAE